MSPGLGRSVSGDVVKASVVLGTRTDSGWLGLLAHLGLYHAVQGVRRLEWSTGV